MSHETKSKEAAGTAPAVVSCSDASSKVEVIVYTTKSDKTLKQNMNAKDDTLRKRTSLIIVPQQVDDIQTGEVEDSKNLENGNRNSVASMDSCVSNTTSQSNQSRGSSSSESSSSSASSSGSDVDAHAAYQDLQNGNAGQELHSPSPSPSPRCHSSSSSSASESTSCSSSADYSLREQLKNFANRKAAEPEPLRASVGDLPPSATRLLKGMSLPVGDQQQPQPVSSALCDALLSPQEVPLGRRYAEVAQFKGHPKAR